MARRSRSREAKDSVVPRHVLIRLRTVVGREKRLQAAGGRRRIGAVANQKSSYSTLGVARRIGKWTVITTVDFGVVGEVERVGLTKN